MKITLSVKMTKDELDKAINDVCLKCPCLSSAGDYSKCDACRFRKVIKAICNVKGLDYKEVLGED